MVNESVKQKQALAQASHGRALNSPYALPLVTPGRLYFGEPLESDISLSDAEYAAFIGGMVLTVVRDEEIPFGG